MTRRLLIVISSIVGAIGVILLLIGFTISPTQAAFSYLTAWAFAVSIALGALIFAMMGQAIEARWTVVFEPVTRAIIRTLPLLALGFVPIALAAPHLYAWIHPSPELGPEALARIAHKGPYLDVTFWVIRAVIYFVLWVIVGELVARGPRKALSAAMFPAIALTLTFAAFDWLMSLTPLWYSTIYGLMYWSGGFVGALALIALVIAGTRLPVSPDNSGALGRMIFAFLVFWAYMEFSQGLIIWIANKPDEVPWYIARGAGMWGGTFAVLLIGHFFVPFFVLLSRSLKRNRELLAIAGGWLVLMHYVDMYWHVMPVLHRQLSPHWLDLAAPCAVLGCATAFGAARRPAPLPADDPRLTDALRYEATS